MSVLDTENSNNLSPNEANPSAPETIGSKPVSAPEPIVEEQGSSIPIDVEADLYNLQSDPSVAEETVAPPGPEAPSFTRPETTTAAASKSPRKSKGRVRKKANSETNQLTIPGRQVPFSIEAEQGMLGCIMLAPKENLNLFLSMLKGKDNLESIFYDVRHQTLISQMTEMYNEGVGIDDITLIQRLTDKGLLDAAGGIAYVSSLKEAPPSPLNMSYYLNIVRDKYLLRSLVQTCTQIAEDVYGNPGDVELVMDRAEKEILRINGEWTQSSTQSMQELVMNAFQTVQNYFARKGKLTGLGTGFTQLDKLTSGLHGGEMIVIAARPGMGKTSLAMNIAEHVAIELQQPVGVFSLEMTAESLVMRMLCSRTHISMQSIRAGILTRQDFTHMTGEAGKLASAPIHIDDTPGLSILNLRSRARRMMENGVKLFVIDYLQLMHSSISRGSDSNRQQEIADISNGVKSLAKELNVPIIILSQLNRDVEKEKNRTPRLSDLRESGAIEQDADIVLLIYRPNNKQDFPNEEDGGGNQQAEEVVPVKIIIAKQRNGPTGDIDLIFLKNYTRFENVVAVRPEDVRQ